jgi:hypothetical protein
MAQLTNVTDRISHLRDRKGGSPIMDGHKPIPKTKHTRERTFATDLFVLFVYALLGIAIFTQLLLLVWLDLI